LDHTELTQNSKVLQQKMRIALLANGIDLNGRLSGFASATHGRAEMDETVVAFGAALRMLREEGELPQR